MRKGMRLLIGVLFITAVFMHCRTIKLEYKYPEGLTAEKEKELKSRVKTGKKLFRKYCEDCHGITIKTKDTAIKLDLKNTSTYQNNFLKGDYKNHAFTQGLDNKQLTDILLFLAVIKLDSK